MTDKDFEFITDKIGIWFANLKLKSFRHTFDGDTYPSSALVTDYELFIAKLKKDIEFIPEEPVSEDICNQCKAHNDKDKCDELVFGHNCPIVTTSEDLEEASEEYTSKVLERTNVLIGNQPVGEEIEAAFRAGAEWADCHQAEKDLALSWEDIELISNILLDVFITTKEDDTPRKEKYEKVLKHFMMERE